MRKQLLAMGGVLAVAVAFGTGCSDDRTVVRRQTEMYTAHPAPPPVGNTTVIERRTIHEEDD